jgi:hypothetical protein
MEAESRARAAAPPRVPAGNVALTAGRLVLGLSTSAWACLSMAPISEQSLSALATFVSSECGLELAVGPAHLATSAYWTLNGAGAYVAGGRILCEAAQRGPNVLFRIPIGEPYPVGSSDARDCQPLVPPAAGCHWDTDRPLARASWGTGLCV